MLRKIEKVLLTFKRGTFYFFLKSILWKRHSVLRQQPRRHPGVFFCEKNRKSVNAFRINDQIQPFFTFSSPGPGSRHFLRL